MFEFVKEYLMIKSFLKKYRVCLVIFLVLLVMLVPMFNMFRYVVINAEDLLYGIHPHHIWEDTHSLGAVIKDAVIRTYSDYFGWQGSFVSVFLMYMQPGIFSTQFYRVIMFLMFLMCLVCPAFCILTFNKHILKAEKRIILAIIGMLLIVITQYMPNAYQAWYWYNGAIYYQFTFNLLMLYITCTIVLAKAKKGGIKIFCIISLVLLNIMCSASNYITSVAFIACYGIFIIFALVKKYKYRYLHLGLIALYIAVFMISVMSPGNAGRATHYTQPSLPLVAVFSVKEFFLEGTGWIGYTLTFAAICISLFFAKDLVKNSKIKFANPFIALLFVGAVLIAQYAPTIYGFGHAGPARCTNIRFLTMQLGLWALAINLYGWLYQKGKLEKVQLLPVVVLTIFIVVFALTKFPVTNLWSYKALDSFMGGYLHDFGEEMDYRLSLLEDKTNDEPIEFTKIITNEMLHPDPELWWDWGLWDFYRKTPKR